MFSSDRDREPWNPVIALKHPAEAENERLTDYEASRRNEFVEYFSDENPHRLEQ